jgi:hypothetical protein
MFGGVSSEAKIYGVLNDVDGRRPFKGREIQGKSEEIWYRKCEACVRVRLGVWVYMRSLFLRLVVWGRARVRVP